jgi:hypothetical protein
VALLDIEQHARETQGRAVGRVVRPAVRLDPAVDAVMLADAVLAGVGTRARDRLGNGGHQARLVLGVDRGHHRLDAETGAAELGVQTKGLGEARVGGEVVGRQLPHPGADDGARRQRELHALGGEPCLLVTGRKCGLGFTALSYVEVEANHARRSSVRTEHAVTAARDPAHSAVRQGHAELVAEHAVARLHGGADSRLQPRQIVGMHAGERLGA